MAYDISLYKVPNDLKEQDINEDILFDIVHEDIENENYLLAYTNFSMGNPKGVDFAEVFDIILTNNDYFKIYKMNDYHRAKSKLETLELDDLMLERINKFLNVIKHELNNGEIIFFCCD
ncbi:hypothetical protein JOC94_002346 [Bacillus thermophilus]|uniref:DUF1877 domain-containing protein n=1 Tax=Siminovitchia thermophila TaxID=1245522 RepID=A0ABS2R897_9BACI|nr:hypothetical protein [Siminovitchia thermophila]MBM7715359.1 hypothetical protein [Siminovitchia thermophila]